MLASAAISDLSLVSVDEKSHFSSNDFFFLLKGALCSFGQEILTQGFNIYDINDVIIKVVA